MWNPFRKQKPFNAKPPLDTCAEIFRIIGFRVAKDKNSRRHDINGFDWFCQYVWDGLQPEFVDKRIPENKEQLMPVIADCLQAYLSAEKLYYNG